MSDTELIKKITQRIKNAQANKNISNAPKINLLKSREETFKIVLEKKTDNNIISRVGLVIDISGSMRKLYKEGIIQEVVERIFPIAKRFDDDELLDMWIFASSYNRLPQVNENNFDTFIQKEVLDKRPSCSWGGTEYNPVMSDVIEYYKDSATPAFVIFITDGSNSDKTLTKDTLRQASFYPIFWQYIGIGKEKFDFLERLDELNGRFVDNANFFKLNDLQEINDNDLYSRLLTEFPEWLKSAKAKNIVK
ncbi:MAG TPA: VWA domain-containing protein [Pseudobacteroides sp.]|uniref:vWA domain-containing protein n=1 Tax=Pseudobacteroides sp. TaxID=1968840 RepID=UPI002F95AC8D